MSSKPVSIARRSFLKNSTGTVAGITALAGMSSCAAVNQRPMVQTAGAYPNADGEIVTFYNLENDWLKKPDTVNLGAVPGVAVDAQDRVWVITRTTPVIQCYDTTGRLVTAWGNADAEEGSQTNADGIVAFPNGRPQIHDVTIDHEGNVWISGWWLQVVYKCSPDGKLLMTLGTFNEGGEDETHFNQPNDVAIAPNGDIFVADGETNSRIVHFDKNGNYVKAWGTRGNEPGQFVVPHAVAFDSEGLLYVADRGNTRVQIFDQDGKFVDQWPDIIVPFDLKVTPDDEVWIAGYGPLRNKIEYHLPRTDEQMVMRFNKNGRLLMNWTFAFGNEPGQMDEIHGMAIDSKGDFYFGEVRAFRVQKFVKG